MKKLIIELTKDSQHDIFSDNTRGKENLDLIPCDQFLHSFEISRAFLHAKQVAEKARENSKHCNFAHKAAVLIFRSL